MNDFKDSIKITKEDKQIAIVNILHTVTVNSPILSMQEVLEHQPDAKKKLSEDEILATYALAKELKISFNHNMELYQYLNIENLFFLDKEKLLLFIEAAVKDIETMRRRTPNVKWELSTGKIIDRMKGKKDTYDEEEFETENSNDEIPVKE